MPIKEILGISAAVFVSIVATHPTRPLEAIREVQFRILHDLGRTDTWGNPSLFIHRRSRSPRHKS
jgi:hypothetical protein